MIPLLDTVLDLVRGPLDKLIVDKDQRDRLNHEIEMAALRAGLAQASINREEARHASLFVAGWRPCVGWVCALALFWHFMLFDLLNWARLVFFPDTPPLPDLSGTETLVTVLMSMLGLGGLRTVEKLKGVDRQTLK